MKKGRRYESDRQVPEQQQMAARTSWRRFCGRCPHLGKIQGWRNPAGSSMGAFPQPGFVFRGSLEQFEIHQRVDEFASPAERMALDSFPEYKVWWGRDNRRGTRCRCRPLAGCPPGRSVCRGTSMPATAPACGANPSGSRTTRLPPPDRAAHSRPRIPSRACRGANRRNGSSRISGLRKGYRSWLNRRRKGAANLPSLSRQRKTIRTTIDSAAAAGAFLFFFSKRILPSKLRPVPNHEPILFLPFGFFWFCHWRHSGWREVATRLLADR